MTERRTDPMLTGVNDSKPLAGQVALVCGATGHIGGAVAHALADMGARVGVHYFRGRERALQLVGELPGTQTHAPLGGDLCEPGGANRVFADAQQQMGAPPTVVIDAAYPAQGPCFARDLSDQYLEKHLDGLRAHINVCQAALPGMRAGNWGRIVLIAGALGWRPFPGFSLYAAVKAGATAFARTLALEEGRHGITVNVIALGRVENEGGEAAFNPHPAYEALHEVTQRRIALTRMASPADVAATVRYLAAPDAEAVTGQVIFLAAGEPM